MSVVELTLSATRQPPADALRDLAAQCDALGVTSYDCYGDGPLRPEQSWLRQFEADVAACTGKESAVFMGSGVMAQDIALSIYGHIDCRTDRRQTFVCHYTSHILLHEQDSYSCLLHLDAAVIAKDESVSHQQPITYAALEPFLNAQPAPVCVLLECPHREIGGKLTPWEDLVAISAHCRRAGIPLHMDGARLWEVLYMCTLYTLLSDL